VTNPLEHLPAKWRDRARTYGKPVVNGALFAGGALVLLRLFGPRVASRVGESGGEGFAQGVARAEDALARVTSRGSRFG
jgi:hypothetical protein